MLWNSRVLTVKGYRFIFNLKPGDLIKSYNLESGYFNSDIISVSKSPRKTPWRVCTESTHIDTYPTEKFLVKRPNHDDILFIRLSEIKKSFKFGIYNVKQDLIIFEDIKFINKDPAKMRHYKIESNTKTYIVNGFIIQP